jgi:hypothetical protein
MMPTAMNPEVGRRMAWNHCHTPYDALSAYYLFRSGWDLDAAGLGGAEGVPIPMEIPGRVEWFERSGLFFCRTATYYAVFFAGCPRSYAWSAACHFTGAPGFAMIGIPGHGALAPCLDGVVTDVPFDGDDPCGRGRVHVEVSTGHPPVLHFERGVRRRYVFLPAGILIFTRGVGFRWALTAPVRDDGDWSTEVSYDEGEGGVVARNGRAGIAWRLLGSTARVTRADETTRHSNPRGYAKLVRLGRLPDGGSAEIATATWIEPFSGAPSTPAPSLTVRGSTLAVNAGGIELVDDPRSLRTSP